MYSLGLVVNQNILRIQLVRKLWVHLTPKETYGLSSPDKIQRLGQSLGDVRRKELSNLIALERQLNEVRRGYSTIDSTGKLVPTAQTKDIQGVKFSSFIESSEPRHIHKESLPSIAKMLANAVEVSQFDALERLLRLQKLYLLTERIILSSDIGEIEKNPLDRRWFDRWKLSACEVSNGGLQQLWARVLLEELKRPNSSSLWALSHLSSFNVEDAENLNKIASLCCGDFIYRGALQALTSHYEPELFEQLEERSILRGVYGKVLTKTLTTSASDGYLYNLEVADKVLAISPSQPRAELHLPAYPLTSVGKELVSLVSCQADPVYVERIVEDLQTRGMNVEVSDDHSNLDKINRV